jgi:hypothetical protein
MRLIKEILSSMTWWEIITTSLGAFLIVIAIPVLLNFIAYGFGG